MQITEAVLCCLIGYLLGNFSPAYLFGKIKGYDIRKEGSGNVGATNAFILVGKHAFFITAALDILKAFAAWKLCAFLFPDFVVAGPLAGVACVVGHMYPVFLGFQGGKGLASLGGVVLAWHWQWFFFLLGAAILIAFATRYVCLVAPIMSVVIPGCYYWDTGFVTGTAVLLLPAIPIFVKHWENFVRIREGTEMRTSFIWNKEAELRRIGKWNQKTENQLKRREQ
ncbi:MAG: glycerol-3-phosphate acyltransferase [Oscillospiraceae bacterium]|nr:glycerol-3-phosphate acyltransferase [Oscillospiraceae bacterium]